MCRPATNYNTGTPTSWFLFFRSPPVSYFHLGRLSIFVAFALILGPTLYAAEPTPRELVTGAKRIVFLGDSNTYAGHYVADLEAWLYAQKLKNKPHVVQVGLPSETVSGLSEDGHAGGQFPRPDVAERLDRVLALTKPDLVFACYGMNCGIYQPFDEGRFAKYQEGIKNLRAACEKAGAEIVHLTPPYYDNKRKPLDFSYNDLLGKYSQWLLSQRKAGWNVVDLHTPMTQGVMERRKSDPEFTYSPDAVHPTEAGHWVMASAVLRWLGDEKAATAEGPLAMLNDIGSKKEILPLVQQRANILRDAYLGEAGHKRPGIAKGLPVAEAEAKAKEIDAKIVEMLK
jgi:lysophospholipase L1-like esterase